MGQLPHYLPKEKRNPKGAKPLKKTCRTIFGSVKEGYQNY
jgi:hypothetical protein